MCNAAINNEATCYCSSPLTLSFPLKELEEKSAEHEHFLWVSTLLAEISCNYTKICETIYHLNLTQGVYERLSYP